MRGRYDVPYYEGYATWNPASLTVSPCDVTSVNVTVAGAVVGDFAMVSFSNDVVDLQLEGHVVAANTVAVTVSNLTDVTVDLASGTIRARAYPM